jgi:hypothetical protein
MIVNIGKTKVVITKSSKIIYDNLVYANNIIVEVISYKLTSMQIYWS